MNIEHIDLVLPPDYPREVGLFLGGLEKVRRQWREAVKDLSDEELARKIFPEVQSIRTLYSTHRRSRVFLDSDDCRRTENDG